ncbi:MAG: class I SAM-dependent methyltransferase [Paracoccaceae bacterium]
MQTDTAHLYWNREWQGGGDAKWTTPEPMVTDHARGFAPGARVLDLGAGLGRHALALARMGFAVEALDASPAALDAIGGAARIGGQAVGLHAGMMTALPFPDLSFDHVISWNVIYHGDEEVVRATIAEVARVLKPGGTFLFTMLSARRLPVEQARARGRELSPGTWVFDGDGDKVHPHYFCDARTLLVLMPGFEPLFLQDLPHDTPGSWHWHVIAERT